MRTEPDRTLTRTLFHCLNFYIGHDNLEAPIPSIPTKYLIHNKAASQPVQISTVSGEAPLVVQLQRALLLRPQNLLSLASDAKVPQQSHHNLRRCPPCLKGASPLHNIKSVLLLPTRKALFGYLPTNPIATASITRADVQLTPISGGIHNGATVITKSTPATEPLSSSMNTNRTIIPSSPSFL